MNTTARGEADKDEKWKETQDWERRKNVDNWMRREWNSEEIMEQRGKSGTMMIGWNNEKRMEQ
jgi:hypothetical protein